MNIVSLGIGWYYKRDDAKSELYDCFLSWSFSSDNYDSMRTAL